MPRCSDPKALPFYHLIQTRAVARPASIRQPRPRPNGLVTYGIMPRCSDPKALPFYHLIQTRAVARPASIRQPGPRPNGLVILTVKTTFSGLLFLMGLLL